MAVFRNVVIATHVFSFGTSQALHAYFKRKRIPALFIEHQLFGNVASWSFGAFDTFWQVARTRKKYDLFVGSNNLNAFVGTLCKKLGLVSKVIYFSPDYSHQRFRNKLLNAVYHWLDYYCLKNADLVWNSSAVMQVDPMMREREKRGVPVEYRLKQIQVPDGTDVKEILPFDKIDQCLIGFVGHLKEGMGLDLLFDVFPEIRDKVPGTKLLIIGSGPLEERLRARAMTIGNIEMTGYMGDIDAVYQRLSYCAVAVAPYDEGTISQYTDPGKVKVYLSVGLPMVITRVPYVADEVDRERCGIAIQPGNRRELVDALTRLISDESLLRAYRKNTLKLRDKYSWDTIFDRALSLSQKDE